MGSWSIKYRHPRSNGRSMAKKVLYSCIPLSLLLRKVTAILVTVTKDGFWNHCNINRDLNDENLKCHI